MKKIAQFAGLIATLFGMMATIASCNPEPAATDLEFGYTTFSANEGADSSYISVYLMKTPYKYPVVVDMEVNMTGGQDAEKNDLALDDVIEFITTDQTYTVEKTGARSAVIRGVEVTYTDYNKKVYFSSKDNDYLQWETITIEFKISKVEGSELGSIDTTTLTIIDDEKAPLVKVGYYDTQYTAPTDATREESGQFYMRLQKVDKYHYVASGLFGLPRPRLYGEYKPESNTIEFDGTDYDHTLWAEATADDEEPFVPINAFQNDTIWANAYNSEGKITQVLKLFGAGEQGTEPIVMTTEDIAENEKGVVLSIATPCGFNIYNYNDGNVGAMAVGTYDSMEHSESMTFSTTNYPNSVGTRSAVESSHPTPFSAWSIAE